MTDIQLHTDGNLGFTCVPNAFIDEYMLDANGEFVKIYLYLLRQLGQADGRFSIDSMADALGFTEGDVRRGLAYWEKMQLLGMSHDAAGNLNGICLKTLTGCKQISAPATVQQTAAAPVVTAPAEPAQPEKKPAYSASDLAEFKNQDNVQELLMVAETYMGHTLTMTDMNTILFWYDELGFSTELIEYLVEYCVEKGHGSIHYMNKVAQNWAADGIATLEDAKQNTNIHSQSYYAVMKAFGISGRNLVANEVSYIEKWTGEFGFTLDIINEACGRTIRNIGKANFEYADTILTNWHKKGIQHLEDVSTLDKAYSQSKPTKTTNRTPKTNNRFQNFEKRAYDDDYYVDLEQQLLRK